MRILHKIVFYFVWFYTYQVQSQIQPDFTETILLRKKGSFQKDFLKVTKSSHSVQQGCSSYSCPKSLYRVLFATLHFGSYMDLLLPLGVTIRGITMGPSQNAD